MPAGPPTRQLVDPSGAEEGCSSAEAHSSGKEWRVTRERGRGSKSLNSTQILMNLAQGSAGRLDDGTACPHAPLRRVRTRCSTPCSPHPPASLLLHAGGGGCMVYCAHSKAGPSVELHHVRWTGRPATLHPDPSHPHTHTKQVLGDVPAAWGGSGGRSTTCMVTMKSDPGSPNTCGKPAGQAAQQSVDCPDGCGGGGGLSLRSSTATHWPVWRCSPQTSRHIST